MIYNLKSYQDLGKCALGTLLDKWDTDIEEIYVFDPESTDIFSPSNYHLVKINSLDDLFKFLWTIPTLITGRKDEDGVRHNTYYVSSLTPWWKRPSERYTMPGSEEKEKARIKYYDNYLRRVKRKIRLDNKE